MPQLSSGRHFGLAPSPILRLITEGTDESRSYWIMQFRLHIRSPTALRDTLPIVYYRENEGPPPDAPAFPSGLSVTDILSGKSDWTPEEMAEFEAWLLDNPRLEAWTQAAFDEIDEAIKNNSVWQSPLWMDG